MRTLLEIYQQSFPKRLRFDKASQVLYAQCYCLNRQYKHKKYIPEKAIRNILDGYASQPGAPWLQLPVVRHLLLIRLASAIRGFMGQKTWLYNRNVEEEHHRIQEWLDKAAKTSMTRRSTMAARAASSSASSSSLRQDGFRASSALEGMVEREKFEREVLQTFHVATLYQRMMRLGFVLVGALCFLLYLSLHTDSFLFWYLRYWQRYGRPEILDYFREVTKRHTVAEVPPAYAGLLPPPCVQYTDEVAGPSYAVNVVEMVHPQHRITVFAMPCPQVGERAFYSSVGAVAEVCDAVFMEGVSFDMIDKLVPAVFFPLKDNTFSAIGVHHRFLDVLRRSSAEPPMLYPAGAELGWRSTLLQALIPYELRCVYRPTQHSATKGEARVGWGCVRQVIDNIIEEESSNPTGERQVLCLPWTVNQIVNLEASLVKYGFKVKRVFQLYWQKEDHMGEHFCAYFDISA